MVEIELPSLPPREFSRNARVHWHVLHRVQQETFDDVLALLLESGWHRGTPALERAFVEVTFYLPDRRGRDADNLVTRAKPVMDALVQAGVIQDDSLDCIGIPVYRFEHRPRQPGTRVRIQERKLEPGK